MAEFLCVFSIGYLADIYGNAAQQTTYWHDFNGFRNHVNKVSGLLKIQKNWQLTVLICLWQF